MSFALIFSPFRLAFYGSSLAGWGGIELGVDAVFVVDLVLNFFTAYFDSDERLVDNPKSIAWGYLRSWFLVDLVSVAPVSLFTSKSVNDLFRIARVARINRTIETFK